jgi:MFS transporter, DHA1 family, multidrug resistance protein
MAIVRDLFVGHAAARLLSRLMLVMGAASRPSTWR